MGIAPFDHLIRGGGVALLILLALLSLRGRGNQRLLAFVYACGASFLLATSPAARAWGPLHSLLVAVAGMGPFLFLIALRRAFGATPHLSNAHIAAFALTCGALAVAPFLIDGAGKRWFSIASDTLSLSLFAAVAVSMLTGLGDDLDATRRSLRYSVSAAGGLLGVAIAAVALVDQTGVWFQDVRLVMGTLTPAICLALIGALCVATLKLKDEPARRIDKPTVASGLTAKILHAFDVDRIYRKPDLTLSTLARRLATPEHQLRAAINADLGHRNFSAFVNAYRLKDVMAALQDKSQAETPISTIALDAGFGSLASFNRVFKAETDKTPNEVRSEAARK